MKFQKSAMIELDSDKEDKDLSSNGTDSNTISNSASEDSEGRQLEKINGGTQTFDEALNRAILRGLDFE